MTLYRSCKGKVKKIIQVSYHIFRHIGISKKILCFIGIVTPRAKLLCACLGGSLHLSAFGTLSGTCDLYMSKGNLEGQIWDCPRRTGIVTS